MEQRWEGRLKISGNTKEKTVDEVVFRRANEDRIRQAGRSLPRGENANSKGGRNRVMGKKRLRATKEGEI